MRDASAAITNEVYCRSANKEARKYVRLDVANDPAVYPSPEILKTRLLLKSR
jgi:putrescine transport system substrate-binding protein